MTAEERAEFLQELRASVTGPRPLGNSFGIEPDSYRWNQRLQLIEQMEADPTFVPEPRVVTYTRQHLD